MSKSQTVFKAIALFLVFSVMNVYVMAGPAASSSSVGSATEASSVLSGKLMVSGDNGISLNGNNVDSGTTVFSGAQLSTSDKAGATVQLANLGSLDITPTTNLTLTFTKGNVAVNVLAGDAILTTNEGVKGSLTTADGKTFITDPSTVSSVSAQNGQGAQGPGRRDRGASGNAGTKGISRALLAVGIGSIVASILLAILLTRNNNNPSPSSTTSRR